jgi:hypothetical protein
MPAGVLAQGPVRRDRLARTPFAPSAEELATGVIADLIINH